MKDTTMKIDMKRIHQIICTEEIAEKRDTPFLKRKLTGRMEKIKLKV